MLFSTDGTGANPGGVDPDETASATSAGRIWTVDTTSAVPQDTLSLKANMEFNFTSQKPIFAVGRYENADVQKAYWVDNLNNMRFANLEDDDVSTQDVDQFDIISNVTFEKPELSDIGGGSLNVGVVQYAYQLFNDNGAETTYSPASNLVHLTRSGDKLINSKQYKGSPLLDDAGDVTNSGKSVTMTVSNIDTSFDSIRIVAIHYTQLNATPSINLVAVKPVQSSIIFTDGGVYDQGSVSLSSYRLLSQRLFTARTLETKDNILFAGNITDRFFDVEYDARAYRFNDSREGRIFESDGVTLEKLIGGTAPSYPVVGGTGLEIDAYNIMNDISIDGGGTRTAGNTYVFQADGTRMGGTGPNISYTFGIDNEILEASDSIGGASDLYSRLSDGDDIDLSYSNYASPYVSGTMRGYHRSEIYRFGIVLYDDKGRVSPVKWIGDIRMPDMNDTDSVTTYTTTVPQTDFRATRFRTDTGRVYMNVLRVDFSVSNLPSTVAAYQIVRVRREEHDRTVLAQGEILQTRANPHNASLYTPKTDTLTNPYSPDNNTALSLIHSPEVSFNKNLTVGGSDFIEAVCGKKISTTGGSGGWEWWDIGTPNGYVNKFRGCNLLGATELSSRYFDVTDGQIVPPGTTATQYNINSVLFANQVEYGVAPYNSAYGGTVLAINEPDLGWMASGGAATAAIVNYRRPVSQYGGASYEDRSINDYIACSDSLTAGIAGATAYGGDTYIGYFDHQRIMWDVGRTGGAGQSWVSVHYVAVETSINLALRNDDPWHRAKDTDASYLLQEEAGVHTNTTDTYTQETDLYSYNSAYSQENTSKQYLPIDSNFSEQTKSDALVIASGVKTNGELIDSWTQFKETEEIEVDTRYGPLSKLLNFRNHLVFFQDNGVGTVGINQQTLLSDVGNLPELTLGKGDILSRYDYITIDSGCEQQEAVCSSAQGFYWYDTVKNKFSRYSGQLQNISDVKGLFAYFNNNVHRSSDGRSDLFTGNQIMSIFDDKYMEATYSFKDIRAGLFVSITSTLRVEFRKGELSDIEDGDVVYVDGVETAITDIERTGNDGDMMVFNPVPDWGTNYNTVGTLIPMYFSDSDKNFTLTYNELMDAFAFFPSYTPQSYIDTFQGYFSVTGGISVFEHNNGSRGTFYDVTSASTVQPLVNPNADTINVYNNVELMTEVYDTDDSNVVDETVSSVRVTNDYQDSGVIAFVPGTNIKRRLRKWRFLVPRESTARIRDAHAKMLFSYSNTGNKRFIFHDVITHFIPREF